MAISNGVITVAATADGTVVFTADADGQYVLVHNEAASVDMFFGVSTLTAANGFPVAAGGSLSVFVEAGASLRAIVATATQPCRFIAADRN